MLQKSDFQRLLPYSLALIVFIALSVIYMHPVLDGKRLFQHDVKQFAGMSKEIADFREETGEEALWAGNMFSGMPAYMISVRQKNNIARDLVDVLTLYLPRPVNMLFLYFVGFFILMLILQRNIWLAVFGAIAFALSSYFIIILEAGHNTKALAIGLMPPLFGGIYLLFRKKLLAGFLITTLFTAMQISVNHLQITYYLFLVLLAYGISEVIIHAKNKELKSLLKPIGLMIVSLVIALGVNTVNFWIAYEAGRHSIRGEPVLTEEVRSQSSGLDVDYILAWSYGKKETITLLVPDFKGGGSRKELSENSNTYQALIQNGVPRHNAREFIKQVPTYWGTQPFTSGPVYAGALVVFLFIFGFFLVENRYRWWMLAIVILAIFLSWGKNMQWFSQWFIYNFPGYDKFRAVSMILVIPDFIMPLMAAMAIRRILLKQVSREQVMKVLKYTTYSVGGFLLFILLFATELFTFSSPADNNMVAGGQIPQWLMDAIREDRIRLMRIDTFRSLVIIALGAAAIWLWMKNKIKAQYAIMAMAAITLIDLWGIGRRYLNEDNFIPRRQHERPYTPTEADLQIMGDPDPHFRVYSQIQDPFREARTSYFHRSIGGYHGAKLQRYQDIIDYHLVRQNMSVLNMLNAKYFIVRDQNNQPQARKNPDALGNAWFVPEYHIVQGPDEAIAALNDFDPATEAIIEKNDAIHLKGKSIEEDESATIKLDHYQPNYLRYTAKTNTKQLAVFSEVYFPGGWEAYINGQEAKHFRVNYTLRAMVIPPGQHEVEFYFRPDTFYKGRIIAGISSAILIVILAGGAYMLLKKRNEKTALKPRNKDK